MPYLCSLEAINARKKYHTCDYNFVDLEMTLKIIGKMSNNIFWEVYFL